VRFPVFVFGKFCAFSAATHEVQQDAGGEKFPPLTFPLKVGQVFDFGGVEFDIFPKPGFGFGDVPEAPFTGKAQIFVEDNGQKGGLSAKGTGLRRSQSNPVPHSLRTKWFSRKKAIIAKANTTAKRAVAIWKKAGRVGNM